jgi:acyl carrier protein
MSVTTPPDRYAPSAQGLSTHVPGSRKAGAPAPTPAPGFDPLQTIIKIISDKTGYPEDMVDPDMNIESDLGIDSIKRIEVVSELNNQLPGQLTADDVPAIAMLHTIREIGDYLKKKQILA